MIARVLLAAALALGAAGAPAQHGKRADGARERQMSEEQRQRMREDVRDAYRQRGERPERAQGARSMSPEERGRLRRDIEDANRALKR
jgi:hypothetical protein